MIMTGDGRSRLRRFTEPEDAIIRAMWNRGATYREMQAALPGRMSGTIANRAAILGLPPMRSQRFEMQHARAS